MQDRFKFRFLFDNKIYDVVNICFLDNELFIKIDENLLPIKTRLDYKKLMQCTGLKDKNGKLIYEGDIIKITTDEKNEIVIKCYWNEKNMLFFGEILNKKGVCNHYYFKRDYLYYFLENNDYEILSNIYENPKLLN